jgi:predicted TIM-barrel fold metal-dependent hydrolase
MGIDPTDEKIIPFYQKLKELNLPLLSHTGRERAFSGSEDELCDPYRLELPLKLGVRVIMAHIGTTGKTEDEDNFLRAMSLFKKYPNLYADISSLTQINKRRYLARALKDPLVKTRLVYGSDWPLQIFPLVSPFYHLELISIRNAFLANSFKNQWDKDFILKRAMGVDDAIFGRTSEVLQPLTESTCRLKVSYP